MLGRSVPSLGPSPVCDSYHPGFAAWVGADSSRVSAKSRGLASGWSQAGRGARGEGRVERLGQRQGEAMGLSQRPGDRMGPHGDASPHVLPRGRREPCELRAMGLL